MKQYTARMVFLTTAVTFIFTCCGPPINNYNYVKGTMDQTVLIKIALNSLKTDLRLMAVKKLEDQDVLARIALEENKCGWKNFRSSLFGNDGCARQKPIRQAYRRKRINRSRHESGGIGTFKTSDTRRATF